MYIFLVTRATENKNKMNLINDILLVHTYMALIETEQIFYLRMHIGIE